MSRYKRDLYENSTIRNPRIKVSTTNPELKDKIQLQIPDKAETVHWYIRFNIPLDPKSVNKKTMSVTETNGYILKTLIGYDVGRHVIAISPVDIYLPNEYYLLNISKRVKSSKGQKLKKEIHIMFKLIGDEISEFKVLASTAEVAKPRPRTKSYRRELERKIAISKLYSFDKKIFEKVPQYKLPYSDMKINFLVSLAGILISVTGMALSVLNVMFVGVAICFAGIIHLLLQFKDRDRRSMLFYNMGVLSFNAGRYPSAMKRFKKSVSIMESNEMAEYAMNKTHFYLT